MSAAKKELKKLAEEEGGCVDFPTMIFNYGCYHQNIVNKAIHCVGIPIIVATLIILTNYGVHTETMKGLLGWLPFPEEVNLPFGLCFDNYMLVFVVLVYVPLSVVYLISDWLVGLCWLAWSLPGFYLNQAAYDAKDSEILGMSMLTFVASLHIASWLAQFAGHGVFEKRAPALAHNLFFAFLAPFFETFLLLNLVFGYKEGPRLVQIQKLINQDIQEYRASKNPTAYNKVE